MRYTIEAIGHVRGGRADPIDDNWGNIRSTIELDPMLFTSDALAGLDAFSHAEVINRLGVTVCKVLAIEGTWLNVEGLDAIDGTQVIDIKPVMREFLPRGDVRQPEWVSELMMEYW